VVDFSWHIVCREGLVEVPVWLGFAETNDMVLVGFEVLIDTGGLPDEHLGLLLESR